MPFGGLLTAGLSLGSAGLGAASQAGAFAGDPDVVSASDLQPLNPELDAFLKDIFGGLSSGSVLDFLNDPIPLTNLERGAPVLAEQTLGLRKTTKKERKAAKARGETLDKFVFEQDSPFGRGQTRLEDLNQVFDSLTQTGLPPQGVEGLFDAVNQIVDPVSQLAQFNFENEFDPLLRERTSVFSSDVDAQRARELSRIETELGSLKTEGIFELLNNIRADLPVAGQLATVPTVFGLESASAGQSIGERNRLARESTRPGGRILGFLPALANAANSTRQFLPGFNPVGDSTANTISSVAGNLPGGFDALGDLLGTLGLGAGTGTGFGTTGTTVEGLPWLPGGGLGGGDVTLPPGFNPGVIF